MPHIIQRGGFTLYRVWPYRKKERLPAGWVLKINEESVLVCRRDGLWQACPWELNWFYNEEGEYVHQPITEQDFPVCSRLANQRFATRRETLQALQVVKDLLFETS